MTHAIEMHTSVAKRVHVKGSGEIQLRPLTEHVTVYGAHGLETRVRLNALSPAGHVVAFRRRNDYAGTPHKVLDPVGNVLATLPRHGHNQLTRVQRTASGWAVL